VFEDWNEESVVLRISFVSFVINYWLLNLIFVGVYSIEDSIRIRIVMPDSIRIRFESERPIRRSLHIKQQFIMMASRYQSVCRCLCRLLWTTSSTSQALAAITRRRQSYKRHSCVLNSSVWCDLWSGAAQSDLSLRLTAAWYHPTHCHRSRHRSDSWASYCVIRTILGAIPDLLGARSVRR